MLATLKLELNTSQCKERFDYNKSSVLQGVLMEQIDTGYAEFLHSQGTNPYSHYVTEQNGGVFWNIQTLNKQAYDNIIVPLLEDDFNSFYIRHNNIMVGIEDKRLEKITYQELLEEAINNEVGKYYTISFLTPTAFKRGGGYYFFPELANIYKSIAKRLFVSTDGELSIDNDSIEELTRCSYITSYDLHSENYHLEKSRVPGFVGNIVIRLNGDEQLHNMMRTLLLYGTYAGVGIKTSLGMGAIRIR